MTKGDALKLEARIKKIPAGKKIFELTKGDDKTAMNLKSNLQAVNREIKTLVNKVKKMIVEVEALETGKPKKKVIEQKNGRKEDGKTTVSDSRRALVERDTKREKI